MAKLRKPNVSSIKINQKISTYNYNIQKKIKSIVKTDNSISKAFSEFSIFEKDIKDITIGDVISDIIETKDVIKKAALTGAKLISSEISVVTNKIAEIFYKQKTPVTADNMEVPNIIFDTDYKYTPVIKNGVMDTYLWVEGMGYIYYKGKYLEFKNEDGVTFKVPLATVKYKNGKAVYEPMNEQQIESYTKAVTKYYNDVMKNYDTYSDKYKREFNHMLAGVSLVYIDPAYRSNFNIASSSRWVAYCHQAQYRNDYGIVIDSGKIFNQNSNGSFSDRSTYSYMVEAFTHESGHVYAKYRSNSLFNDKDDTETWRKIYSKVSSNRSNANILRDYTLTNNLELFADSVMYYYHDPNRLKMVNINIDGYNTLYDYMDDILN